MRNHTLNNLLPADLVAWPESIFDNIVARSLENHLRQLVIDYARRGCPLPGRALDRLSWYPTLLSDLILRSMISARDLDVILKDRPQTVVGVLVADFTLSPTLEERIIHDAEALTQVYWFARIQRWETPRPLDAYRAIICELDPFFGSYTFSPDETAQRDAYRANVFADARARAYEGPAWAFAHLRASVTDPDQYVEAALADVLKSSDRHAYLSARLLRSRGANSDVWRPLLSAISSPRWAYEIMRAGLAAGQESRLGNILDRNPEWAVEYWREQRLDRDALKVAYHRSLAAADDHPLLPELHHWMQTQFIPVITTSDVSAA